MFYFLLNVICKFESSISESIDSFLNNAIRIVLFLKRDYFNFRKDNKYLSFSCK